MRLVFMGSPDFALPSLRLLLDDPSYEVVGVFTQPDRGSGRGRRVAPPPVKTLALDHGVPVLQPRRFREAAAIEELRALRPELVVVAAYGQILPPAALTIPAHGCVNVHASLLPRWRGAAPVTAAILAGDAESGVSIMVIEAGLDTGPVLARRAIAIAPTDTGGSLTIHLAQEGAHLLIATLPAYLGGHAARRTAGRRSRDVRAAGAQERRPHRLDAARARALAAGARLPSVAGRAHVLQGRAAAHPSGATADGQRRQRRPAPSLALPDDAAGVGVATGDGILALDELQRAGRRALPGAEFVRGERGFAGSTLE